MSSSSLLNRDDPVERIAALLTAAGWSVTSMRWGRRPAYRATRDGWCVIVRSCFGFRAELDIQRPDGTWFIPPLCGQAAYDRACRELGLEPSDLWRQDIVAGLEAA